MRLNAPTLRHTPFLTVFRFRSTTELIEVLIMRQADYRGQETTLGVRYPAHTCRQDDNAAESDKRISISRGCKTYRWSQFIPLTVP